MNIFKRIWARMLRSDIDELHFYIEVEPDANDQLYLIGELHKCEQKLNQLEG